MTAGAVIGINSADDFFRKAKAETSELRSMMDLLWFMQILTPGQACRHGRYDQPGIRRSVRCW